MKQLASIIIPCWNQLEFTRHCIAALMRHTREPWELIVVNNGSTDGTEDYLAGVRDAAPVPVTVIANATNRGFPAAINQGLKVARGEYLVLLNNDVVVTDGWLDQLIALATAKAVRRTSRVGDWPGRADVELCRAAAVGRGRAVLATWRKCMPLRGSGATSTRGKWLTVRKLSGFCLLMKRAVYDAIGGLDERFGMGFFDDDDLAERARRAGFELAVAHDLFVHHFGSRTFARQRHRRREAAG